MLADPDRMQSVTRVGRTARGRRPRYFADPATDRLMSMVLTLAEELSVVRERLDTVERLLARTRTLPPGTVDQYTPDDTAAKARSDARRRFIERLLRAATIDQGEQGVEPTPTEAEIFALLDPQDESGENGQ